MKKLSLGIFVLGIFLFAPAAIVFVHPHADDKPSRSHELLPPSRSLMLPGITQCVAARKAILAPAVLHPVSEVLVALGDAVKKDQPLIKIDDDEQQADVRLKKAVLENTGIAMREAKRYLASLEKLHTQGAISEQRIHDARASALKTEADERAAKAAVDAALAELEHYIVVAPIDGVINRLEVHVGMVSRPGTTEWGEVLDLRELDVRFELKTDHADFVKVGDLVEVLAKDLSTSHGTGRIVFIGMEANAKTERIPALVRLPNPGAKLRCGISVQLKIRSEEVGDRR